MDSTTEIRMKELIEKVVAILRTYGATEVYLFGSARSGNFDIEHSDIDLAVRGIPAKDFYGAVGETMCSLGRAVDVIDLDAETAFGKYLTEHGELARVA
jgi:predicted nucleotidyltransferase